MVPFLALLLFGITDLGRAIAATVSLQDAVSEGALYGSQFPDDYSLVQQRAVDAGDSLGLAPSDVTVTCPDPKSIVVSAAHPVTMITFVGQWFGSQVTVTAFSEGTVFTSGTCQPSP
jgi:Flp pilus assembly protein TadG